MNQQDEENRLAVGLTGIMGATYLLTAIIEALAWSNFGVNWWSKAGFFCLAMVIVWSRVFFSQIRVVAESRGNHKLASTAGNFLLGGIIITMFSMMSLYSDAIQHYVDNQKKNAGPVLLAEAKYQKAVGDYEAAKASAGYTVDQIADAMRKNSAYQAELKAAQDAARAQFDAQTKKVQAELDAFWSTKSFKHEHDNAAVMDENCTPKRTNYGAMTSNASTLCPRLKAILAKFPDVSSDPAVAAAQAKIAEVAGAVSAASVIESAKMEMDDAEIALLDARKNTGVSSGDRVYPPMFHDLHDFFRGQVDIKDISTVFGFAAILLLLLSPHVFQQGLSLLTSDGGKSVADGLIDKIPGGRAAADKLAKVSKPHAPEDKNTGMNGVPAQADTGARVEDDGWMVVHKGNHILNEGAVQIAQARGIDLDELNLLGLSTPVPDGSTPVPADTNSDMGRVSKSSTPVPVAVPVESTPVPVAAPVASTPVPKQKRVQTNRARTFADTGTRGKNDSRYRKILKLILDGNEAILTRDGRVTLTTLRRKEVATAANTNQLNLALAEEFLSRLQEDGIINRRGK